MTHREHTSKQPASAGHTALAPPAGPRAALTALDTHLDRDNYATTLVGEDTPRLHVASRHAQLAEDIYADSECFYWPWGQPIAAIGNPAAAAEKVRYVLGGPGNPHE